MARKNAEMKEFEKVTQSSLMRRTPVIVRVDGRAFHSFTKQFERPFDDILIKTMQLTTEYLCKNIPGCKIGYTQSDEISLLLVDYDGEKTEPFMKYNVQKMVSIIASMATLAFNNSFVSVVNDKINAGILDSESASKYINKFNNAMFDCRVFNLPKEKVAEYFIWRQEDATNNSIMMLAQSNFNHNELMGKSNSMVQDML